MSLQEDLERFLIDLGCRRHHRTGSRYFVLDELGPDFYLLFDATEAEGSPSGTCHIHLCKIGSSPADSEDRICAVSNCFPRQVINFTAALGMEIYKERTQKFIRDWAIREVRSWAGGVTS